MVISGEMPSSIIIGAATGAIAVHFAEPEAIRKSSQADIVVNIGSSSAGGACIARSWSAPTIAVIGPRFDQPNIATNWAAKNTSTRYGSMPSKPLAIIATTSRWERIVPAIAPYAQPVGEEEQKESGNQTAKQRRQALARRGGLVVERREARVERQCGEQRDDTQRGQPRCPKATSFRRRELARRAIRLAAGSSPCQSPSRGATTRAVTIQPSPVNKAAMPRLNHQLPTGFIVHPGWMSRAPVSVMLRISTSYWPGSRLPARPTHAPAKPTASPRIGVPSGRSEDQTRQRYEDDVAGIERMAGQHARQHHRGYERPLGYGAESWPVRARRTGRCDRPRPRPA